MEVLSSRVLLRSRDPESLQHFYRYQLRLAVAREYPGGIVFHAGNGLIEVPGHMSSAPGTDIEPSGALWLQVRDIFSTERELRACHVEIDRAPLTEPWGLIEMHVRDTDGRLLIVVEVPSTHPLRLDNR